MLLRFTCDMVCKIIPAGTHDGRSDVASDTRAMAGECSVLGVYGKIQETLHWTVMELRMQSHVPFHGPMGLVMIEDILSET